MGWAESLELLAYQLKMLFEVDAMPAAASLIWWPKCELLALHTHREDAVAPAAGAVHPCAPHLTHPCCTLVEVQGFAGSAAGHLCTAMMTLALLIKLVGDQEAT
jgi:hypothetical protein